MEKFLISYKRKSTNNEDTYADTSNGSRSASNKEQESRILKKRK